MTGVCIGLGEPMVDGLLEMTTGAAGEPRAPKQLSANNSMDNEDMMFCMDSLSGEKTSGQSKLGQPKATPVTQRKGDKRIRYYVSSLFFDTQISDSSVNNLHTDQMVSFVCLGARMFSNFFVECCNTTFQSGSRLRHGIELTPLPYVPGGRIEHYLGHLNFFIIRETTSVREVHQTCLLVKVETFQ